MQAVPVFLPTKAAYKGKPYLHAVSLETLVMVPAACIFFDRGLAAAPALKAMKANKISVHLRRQRRRGWCGGLSCCAISDGMHPVLLLYDQVFPAPSDTEHLSILNTIMN